MPDIIRTHCAARTYSVCTLSTLFGTPVHLLVAQDKSWSSCSQPKIGTKKLSATLMVAWLLVADGLVLYISFMNC